MNTEYLRPEQAAAYLTDRYGTISRNYLAKLATTGKGPQFQRWGKYRVYTRAALDAWAASRMSPEVASTSELSVAAPAAA